jgi:hypothetical protein
VSALVGPKGGEQEPSEGQVNPAAGPVPSSEGQRARNAGQRDQGVGWQGRRLAAVALAGVMVVALMVRLWGLTWQLPWQFHPDEGHYTWKAIDLMSQGTINPKYFRNPSLLTYVLLGEYKLLGFQPPKSDEQAAFSDGLWRPPSGVAFVGRLTSALMGVLTVLAIGWIGWRALGPWTGVLGALFLALAFIHVRDSHYATNDVPAVLLLTLAVGATVSLLQHPKLGTYLLAGLLGGLATSTKYNAGLFVVPLLLAHGLVVWRAWRGPASSGAMTRSAGARDTTGVGDGVGARPGRGAMNCAPTGPAHVEAQFIAPDRPAIAPLRSRILLLVLPIVLAGLVALVAYLAGTPFTVLDFPKWRADFLTQASFVDEGWEGQAKLPLGLPYLLGLGAGMGWVMLALSVVGAVISLRRYPSFGAVLVAFPVAYLLFMQRSELFFIRFALPPVPFLCLLAAVAVVSIVRTIAGHRRSLAAPYAVILVLAAVAQPTFDTVRHNLLIAQEDTRAQAAEWALANLAPGTKMAVEEYTIRDRRPRAYGGPVWKLDTDLLDVNQLRRADPTAPLRGQTRYFMLSSFQQDRFAGGPDAPQRQFYDALAQQGRVVARFSPSKDGEPIPFDLEDLYSPFWSLDRYERPGPTITVYELPPR